eukprot:gb/GEZJ01008640.1/.p1 GENE.gb/GEZJ01008640.1/~~gb/GEZJ01008640.1/.p1  ORF type:complete len:120 (-),score=10.96 gb/GEZJ01008640.1/:108-467(-)
MSAARTFIRTQNDLTLICSEPKFLSSSPPSSAVRHSVENGFTYTGELTADISSFVAHLDKDFETQRLRSSSTTNRTAPATPVNTEAEKIVGAQVSRSFPLLRQPPPIAQNPAHKVIYRR